MLKGFKTTFVYPTVSRDTDTNSRAAGVKTGNSLAEICNDE